MKAKHKTQYRNIAESYVSHYDWSTLQLSKDTTEEEAKKLLYPFDQDLLNEYRGRTPLIAKAKVYSKLEYPVVLTYIQLSNFDEEYKFCFELSSNIEVITEWQKSNG